MNETVLSFIQMYLPMMVLVFTMCSLVLWYGGWPLPNQPRRKPTNIQLSMLAGMSFASIGFLLSIFSDTSFEDRYTLWGVFMGWIQTVSMIIIPIQSVFLRQERMNAYRWSIVLGPAILDLAVELILTHLNMIDHAYVVNYLFYTYILIMYAVVLWKLDRWDKQILEEYSDVTFKQTRWFRQFTMPMMMLYLVWIPASFLPYGEWIWVGYYPLLAFVIIRSTSYALVQEEFELSPSVTEDPLAEEMPEDESHESKDPAWAERLERLMEAEHIYHQQKITRDNLAREVGVNRTYLSSYIQQKGYKNFNDYINTYRIREAEQLLADTDYTIDVISTICGFSSSYVFIRVFKSYNDITPSEWRAGRV